MLANIAVQNMLQFTRLMENMNNMNNMNNKSRGSSQQYRPSVWVKYGDWKNIGEDEYVYSMIHNGFVRHIKVSFDDKYKVVFIRYDVDRDSPTYYDINKCHTIYPPDDVKDDTIARYSIMASSRGNEVYIRMFKVRIF
jgi:hypothetical protein